VPANKDKNAVKTPCGQFPARSFNELIAPYKVDITRAAVGKDGKLGAAPMLNKEKSISLNF